MTSSTQEEEENLDHSATIVDANTQKTIDSIKNTASNIREGSSKVRDTVRTLRQSGAINELIYAVQEAMIVPRDTTREISETARRARDRGVIRDTASAIDETTNA